MRLHHSKDGSTYPGYKLMCFVCIHWIFCKEQNALAFNWDKRCHLALCLQTILLHSNYPEFFTIIKWSSVVIRVWPENGLLENFIQFFTSYDWPQLLSRPVFYTHIVKRVSWFKSSLLLRIQNNYITNINS